MSARRVEVPVALRCGDTLVFRGERVRVASAKRRARGRIRRVELKQLLEVIRGCAREPRLCEIVCKLLVRPEAQGQVSDLHARGEGETWTYVIFEIPSEKAEPSSLTSPGEDAILITKHGKDN